MNGIAIVAGAEADEVQAGEATQTTNELDEKDKWILVG